MIFLFITIVLLNSVQCKNILGLMGCASHSHQLWNSVIFNELALKGYNLTILTVDVSKNHPENVHYIHLEETYNFLFKSEDRLDILRSILSGDFEKIHLYYEYFLLACRGMLQSKGFQILQDYPSDFKFDLVLYDVSMGPCLIGFLHKFNYPPVVGISAFKVFPGLLDIVGGHIYPAYIPLFSMYQSSDMNFGERLYNSVIYTYEYLYRIFVYQPKLEFLATSYYTNDTPRLVELDKLTTLVLVNTHPTIDYPEPLPPNVIEVGGLKINEKPRKLIENLQQFLDASKKGAILISLGTNVNSQIVGTGRQMAILNATSKFPDYNFIWKTDRDSLPTSNIPQNVLILPWIPQSEILAHEKVKAFVTHAGSLSVQEAVWNAVPMVTMPLFVDQPRNARRTVEIGIAEKIDFATLTSNDIYQALKKVLTNPSYSGNIKKLSEKFQDRPMKPLDLAIWWIEYAMRYSDITYLRSPTLALGYFRSNSYDVIAFSSFLSILIIYLVFKGVQLMFRKKEIRLEERKLKYN